MAKTKDTPQETLVPPVVVAPAAGSVAAEIIKALGGQTAADALPIIDVIGTLGPLAAVGALGVGLSLAIPGVPAPVEGLTGSGLEPEPLPQKPPTPPGTAPPVTAAPLIPFNWWQLGQGGNPDLVGPLDPTILARLGAAGETLFNYLTRTSQIGADPNVSGTELPVGGAGLSGVGPGGAASTPPAPVTTISIVGTVPAGAPPIVASPVLAPIGLPEQPPPPGVLPHFTFTVPVPTIPAPELRPGAGPLAGPTIQPLLGPPSPTFSPILSTGAVTAPTTTPAPGLVPSLVPSPLPGPAISPNPAIATPLPIAQLPGLDFTSFAPLGFVSPSAVSPFDQPEEQAFAQAASHANQCQTTKQKGKPRKPRTVCHAGTYVERARGTSKTPERVIQCR